MLKTWVRRSVWDFRCGRHSNIPSCCMIWFILVWPFVFRFGSANSYWERINRLRGGGVDYVVCPLCLALGRVVDVRDCEKSYCECSRRQVVEYTQQENSGCGKRRWFPGKS
jgi:hypothetical protein